MADRKVTDAATRKLKDEAIVLLEQYEACMLLDALDGVYDFDADEKAMAAFSMTDVKALGALVQARKRDGNFIEASTVFKDGDPKPDPKEKIAKGEGKNSLGKREEILTETQGTRLYARKVYADARKLAGAGTPFG